MLCNKIEPPPPPPPRSHSLSLDSTVGWTGCQRLPRWRRPGKKSNASTTSRPIRLQSDVQLDDSIGACEEVVLLQVAAGPRCKVEMLGQCTRHAIGSIQRLQVRGKWAGGLGNNSAQSKPCSKEGKQHRPALPSLAMMLRPPISEGRCFRIAYWAGPVRYAPVLPIKTKPL